MAPRRLRCHMMVSRGQCRQRITVSEGLSAPQRGSWEELMKPETSAACTGPEDSPPLRFSESYLFSVSPMRFSFLASSALAWVHIPHLLPPESTRKSAASLDLLKYFLRAGQAKYRLLCKPRNSSREVPGPSGPVLCWFRLATKASSVYHRKELSLTSGTTHPSELQPKLPKQ